MPQWPSDFYLYPFCHLKKKIDWIKQSQNNNQPFFIATGFIRPHTPLVVPKKYYDKFPLNKIKIIQVHFNLVLEATEHAQFFFLVGLE